MAQFRKKPVVIEAAQFANTRGQTMSELAGYPLGGEPPWYREARTKDAGEAGAVHYFTDGAGPYLVIHTLEGEHRASPGDWIIRGVKGELYPCRDDIFQMTYEAVDAA